MLSTSQVAWDGSRAVALEDLLNLHVHNKSSFIQFPFVHYAPRSIHPSLPALLGCLP